MRSMAELLLELDDFMTMTSMTGVYAPNSNWVPGLNDVFFFFKVIQ